MLRRFVAIAAAAGAAIGLTFGALAAPAKADVTHVVSPVPTGLARVCLIVTAADAGLCLHL